jgi:hypothetical protein
MERKQGLLSEACLRETVTSAVGTCQAAVVVLVTVSADLALGEVSSSAASTFPLPWLGKVT